MACACGNPSPGRVVDVTLRCEAGGESLTVRSGWVWHGEDPSSALLGKFGQLVRAAERYGFDGLCGVWSADIREVV